jgi:uncharacterized integral membrane protein
MGKGCAFGTGADLLHAATGFSLVWTGGRMKLHTLLLLVVIAALAVFAAVNWSAFTAPTTLSLVFRTVEAPLGLIMLAAAALLTVLFLLYLGYLQATVLLDARRHSRELEASRSLADQAEASRFSELRDIMQSEMAKLAGRGDQSKEELLVQLNRIESELRSAFEQGSNTLAASIGELEDRIDRMSDNPPSPE